MNNRSFKTVVSNGIKFLQEHNVDLSEINLSRLDLSKPTYENGYGCVLCQIYGDYVKGVNSLNIDPELKAKMSMPEDSEQVQLGFHIRVDLCRSEEQDIKEWNALTAEWKLQLTELRAKTSTVWDKHFGNTSAAGLMDNRVEGFFEELNKAIIADDQLKETKDLLNKPEHISL